MAIDKNTQLTNIIETADHIPHDKGARGAGFETSRRSRRPSKWRTIKQRNQKNDMNDTKIYFVKLESGEENIFYAHPDLTPEQIRRAYDVITKDPAREVLEIRPDDVPYYCIDARVWCDTDEKKEILLSYINQ